MNLKRIERQFTRAWANAAAKLGRTLPELISLTESETPNYDVITSFKGSVQNAEDAFRLTGASVFSAAGTNAALILPAEWVVAPSRLLAPETPIEILHNALLDAGIADWIELQAEADGLFVVEFLDTVTLGQLDALKSRYDIAIPSPDMPICTLREHTAIDPTNVETMLRVRWGGAHAGKIDTIEHTNDPREFVVVTRKPVPLAARLADHGIQQKQQIEPTRIHVRIMDALWEKIEAAHGRNSSAGAPESFIDPASILDPFPFAPPLPDPTPEPPALDERDLLIADLKTALIGKDALIGALKTQLAALTPDAAEWQTLRLTLKRDGSLTDHPEIAAQERLGWQVHSVQYAPNGEDKLFVLLTRKPARTLVWRPVETTTASVNGAILFPDAPRRTALGDYMIQQMNRELEPDMRALATALGVSFND